MKVIHAILKTKQLKKGYIMQDNHYLLNFIEAFKILRFALEQAITTTASCFRLVVSLRPN